jgi:hypothetical protein
MANEQKLHALAERLTAQTEAQKLGWSAETPVWFQLALPSGAVSIRSLPNDGTPPYMLTVYDEDGREIESLQTGMDIAVGIRGVGPWDHSLSELYNAARNSALNIDDVLNRILQDAENL